MKKQKTYPHHRGYVVHHGVAVRRRSARPRGTGLQRVALKEADFINDRGEIIGYASLPNGDEHGFMLIPCDENRQGVEGCDYSMVDASAAAQNPEPVPNATQHSTRSQRRNRNALRRNASRAFSIAP